MRNYFSERLIEYFSANKKSILITADLGYSVFDELKKKFPERYINIGVAEQNMIGVASGINLSGLDVFAYSISNFGVLRCLEHIRNDIIYHNLNVKLCCVGGGFAYGNLGYTHLGVEDIGALSLFGDEVNLYCPSTKDELKKIIPDYFNSKKFSYLRLYRNKEPSLKYDHIKKYYSTKEKIHKNMIVSVGPVSEEIFKLSKRNFYHVNFHTLNNIPKKIFLEIFNNRKIKNILFVEEHTVCGSFYNYYLLKCAEYKIKTKNIVNKHFNLKKLQKNGSYNYLRNTQGMSSSKIEKVIDML